MVGVGHKLWRMVWVRLHDNSLTGSSLVVKVHDSRGRVAGWTTLSE